MGNLGDDLIKMGLGTIAISSLITQAKKEITCGHCGRIIHKGDEAGKCQKLHWIKDSLVCKKCIKICKKCRKIYCPDHI